MSRSKEILIRSAGITMLAASWYNGALAAEECDITGGVSSGANCIGTKSSGLVDKSVTGTLGKVVNVMLWLVGIAAVIMIILAAFSYIFAQGDPKKVEGAKNQIVYALIGVVVSLLALGLVNFVLNKV